MLAEGLETSSFFLCEALDIFARMRALPVEATYKLRYCGPSWVGCISGRCRCACQRHVLCTYSVSRIHAVSRIPLPIAMDLHLLEAMEVL